MLNVNKRGDDSEGEVSDETSEVDTSKKSARDGKSNRTPGPSDDDESGEGEVSEENSETDDGVFDGEGQEDTMDDGRDLPSHNEMKKELINAIIQTRKEKEERMAQNQEF